jgi:hypothetical protein
LEKRSLRTEVVFVVVVVVVVVQADAATAGDGSKLDASGGGLKGPGGGAGRGSISPRGGSPKAVKKQLLDGKVVQNLEIAIKKLGHSMEVGLDASSLHTSSS